jgi:transcriptional regulator with XRE-family HTH domain
MDLPGLFSANMRKYRKQAGMTQERLAELCDTEPAYIGQIETGRRCPSLAYVEKIAAALGVAPYRLFYDEAAGEDDPAAALRREQKQRLKTKLAENLSQICALIDEGY